VRLLVTRPEPDAERTAAKLRTSGHEVELASLLRIEPIEHAELGVGPFAAVLLTSANALPGLVSHKRFPELRSLAAFVVGGRTAKAARAAGFSQVTSADGNQRDLVHRICTRFVRPERRPLLYAAGEDRSGDLAGELGAAGFPVETVVVYRAAAASDFAPHEREALARGRLDGVLHFSRRSAESFLRCAAAGDVLAPALRLYHFCLSSQVAEPLLAAGALLVRVAPRPEEAALIELINAAVVQFGYGRINQSADER
jgi:uroporphyrinogen-III synthase